MRHFNLITFNIHSDAELFAKMAKYVSKKKQTIVAIQERPNKSVIKQIDDLNEVSLVTDRNNSLAFILPKSLNIQKRENPKKDNPNLIDQRTLEIDLPLRDFSVKIVNVHGFSKNANGSAKNQDLFSKIRDFYVSYSKIIFLGDFNTNPYEENMTLSTRFFANRDFADVVKSKQNVFYNPSWRYLSERSYYKGTHFYGPGIPKWNFYDQILISRDLVGVVSGKKDNRVYKNCVKLFHIPKRLGELSFEPSETYDKEKHISDHLPVLLTLEM